MTEDSGQTLDLELESAGEDSEVPVTEDNSAPEEEAKNATVAESGPARSMVPTNRFNLLTCLASRLVQPRSAYRKYYPDPLERVPGAVPILDRAPSADILDELSARNSFPVLIELGNLDGLSVRRPTGSGQIVEGAIPFTRVVAVHFPDERALREHYARPYANIAPADHLFRISPELFTAGSDATEWSLGETVVPDRDWQRVDRLRGAANGARIGATSARTLETAARAMGVPADETAKPASPWLDNLLDLGSRKGKSAEDVLFAASLEVLTAADVQDDWSPRRILDQIEDLVSAKSSKRVGATIKNNLDHIRAVVEGDKEFSPFKAKSNGLTAAKALLMVLLRENLGSLLNWPAAETGADDLTVQTAAVYAGALRGLLREDANLRDVGFDDLTADWAVFGLPAISDANVHVAVGTDGTTLTVGDHVARFVPTPPPPPSEVLRQLEGDALIRAAIDLCKKFGWRELITTRSVWNGQVTVQARSGKTVVSGELVGLEETVAIDELHIKLDAESGVLEVVSEVVKAAQAS
ncbi:hypothetical protein [Gordonia hongkongensis]|uniref:Uncharacterized protein n=1 Tax=Gordonia hongkongensis TaxID=1701090 RepID=A0ABT6C1H2_9ACTN|nr:hypothetical protein [Gordonia hongkongensis]MDF6103642.1 hypothetical protein [Gordonia hongkongensis]